MFPCLVQFIEERELTATEQREARRAQAREAMKRAKAGVDSSYLGPEGSPLPSAPAPVMHGTEAAATYIPAAKKYTENVPGHDASGATDHYSGYGAEYDAYHKAHASVEGTEFEGSMGDTAWSHYAYDHGSLLDGGCAGHAQRCPLLRL